MGSRRACTIRRPPLARTPMATLHIVKYPHESLTTPAAPVEAFDEELGSFLDDMAETMYAARGVGLAANQVAALSRASCSSW